MQAAELTRGSPAQLLLLSSARTYFLLVIYRLICARVVQQLLTRLHAHGHLGSMQHEAV